MINKIFLALIILWSSLSFASDTLDFDVDSLISDVTYQYEIFPDLSPDRMCIGTLSVTFDIPSETEQLIFYYARLHTDLPSPPRVFNQQYVDITGKSSVTVTAEQIKPFAYFSAYICINGQAYRMSNFAVKDYMDPHDLEYLEKLQAQDAVGEVSNEDPVIEIKDRAVSIRCDSVMYLTIRTIDGKNLYQERIDQYAQIPLYPGIFILTYGDKQNSYTKKLMIK